MMTLSLRHVETTLINAHPSCIAASRTLPLLKSTSIDGSDDSFQSLSAVFIAQRDNEKYWWYTTAAPLAQMLKRAFYPIDRQYRYLVFYYTFILPEFGDIPFIDSFSADGARGERCNTVAASRLPDTPFRQSRPSGTEFQSYMTDDHSPIELSWQFDQNGGAVVRFAIDPVRRQVKGDSRGAIGLFEDLGRSNVLARNFNLDWCRICANLLTVSVPPHAYIAGKVAPEYPSQYFVGFDFSSQGIIVKAYFLPETRAAVNSTSKSSLITACVIALSTPTPNQPNPPDLVTPWKRVLSFFSSLPSELSPNFNIVAVDCVPSEENRVKIYARTPRSTLANLRRFITLGREPSSTSSATQRALDQATTLWHLLFPALANEACDDVEPPCPEHPTGGLLWYYELRPGYAEPFPKVYLPVRHWCKSDEQIVNVMEAFYSKIGNPKAAARYGRDVRETYTHRPLSARAGIHTYITIAVKPKDVEVTSYFNPECYAPERGNPY